MVRIRKPFSLRGLLLWFAALGALVLIVVAVLIGGRVSEVKATTDAVAEIYEPAAEKAAALELANSEMDRGISLYVLGDADEGLDPFVTGEHRSDLAMESLVRLEGADPGVKLLVARVALARERWLDEVALPAIKQVKKGDSEAANEILVKRRSLLLFDELETATDTLRTRIDRVRTTAFLEMMNLADQLVWVLGISVLALVASMAVATITMFRWVLDPLNGLRRQIREVARRGNHDKPIVPTGPKELAAVGADAETLRRQLVAEIDEAKSARQALEHGAPLVAAIRRELSMPTDPQVDGADVHGEVIPAEGVLAGDWWDCVATDHGEVAVVVTDISGHGPEAGIAAMRIKHLLTQSLASGTRPDEALDLAARSFADDPGRFATVVVVVVNTERGSLRWANGGHHPPIIFSEDGEFRELKCPGPLLSWLGGPWEVCETTIGPAEYLLCFSDGLIESHDQDGTPLEVEGLIEMLRDVVVTSSDPKELVKRVLARTRDRAVDWDRDDVTLVAMKLGADHHSAVSTGSRG